MFMRPRAKVHPQFRSLSSFTAEHTSEAPKTTERCTATSRLGSLAKDISGRYHVVIVPQDPNAANTKAYFGEDASVYEARSPITHIRESSLPLFIVNAEYENFGLDILGAELFAAVCERDSRCPRYTRLEKHNHISEVASFNTADELLGREILEFVKRGR